MATKKTTAAKISKGTSKAKAAKAATPAKVEAAKANAANPASAYRVGGGYHNSVLALYGLGVDTLHPFASIIPAVKKAFGLGWSEFAKKDQRNDNGKDAEGRIVQNVAVVARKDYGAPLRELGYEVRFDGRQKVAGLFKIKPQTAAAPTAASKPQNVPAASKPKAKGKTAPKAAKPQKANPKAAKAK